MGGDAHKKDNVNIKVDPFKSKKTDVRAADPDREVIRLTFKTEDHKYEVDVPSPNSKSSTMKKLDGGWPLQILSIPGTHNAPTCYKALPSVRCQAVGVPEQLNNGIRFLDIRVSAEPESDTLTLVHSAFPISLTGNKYFGDMCNDIYEFLEKNPSETVIMSVKREGTGKGNDEQMGKHLKKAYVDKKRDRWWTEPRVPKLGEARGKIILMRRFGLDGELKKCWDGKGYVSTRKL